MNQWTWNQIFLNMFFSCGAAVGELGSVACRRLRTAFLLKRSIIED